VEAQVKPSTKAVLATVGVISTGLFNYLAARADSNEAKIRAEVAYETMATSVKELQETVHDMELEHAEMKGKIYELERIKAARLGEAAPKPPSPPRAVEMNAPMNFEDAVQSYKAKK
jgi:hypothetical protein